MRLLILGKNGQLARAMQLIFPRAQALGRADCNLEDGARLLRILERENPDCIINTAAYTAVDAAETDQQRAHLINAAAPAIVASFAAAKGIPLVHFSTDYVFDGRKNGWYTETDATNPLGVYGATKLEGERAVIDAFAAAPARFFILRTSWVYGPTAGDGGNFIKTMLRLAKERDALSVVSDQYGVPSSTTWLAAITRRILDSAIAPGLYHAVPAGSTNWHSLACFAIAEARRHGAPIRVAQEAIAAIPASHYAVTALRPANSRLSHAKLLAALGDRAFPAWQEQVSAFIRASVTK